MRYFINIVENILQRNSCWITDKGEVIVSNNPEKIWHSDEASKYFKTGDPLGEALRFGWIRYNATGHYVDLEFDFHSVSSSAIKAALRIIGDIFVDVNYNIENNNMHHKEFKSRRSVTTFLRKFL